MTVNKKIPALRFKEFEGEWNCTKIEEISKVGSGGTPNRSIATYWNGDIPWITTSLIDSNKIDYADEYITKEGLENSSAKLFPSGAVLMAMYGQGKTRGKVAILGIEATTNQACAAIIVKQEIINPKYLFQNFTGRYDEVRNLSNAGGQENLSGELIKNLKVCFPSLSEQQKIASFLTAVDDKIQQLSKKKALLEQYKKGVMQQIFNQQIRFKDDDGKDYADWEEKKLGDLFSFINTNSFSRNQLNYAKGTVKNIHYGDIHTKFKSNFNILNETVPFVNEENDLKKILEDSYCKEGDLIIADASEDYNDIGKAIEVVNLDNQKLLAGLHTYILRDNKNITAKGFKGYFMQSFEVRLQMMKVATGISVLGITKGNLSKIIIHLPAKEEQQKIANFLTGIDNKINAVARQLQQTQVYKKGLLQQMFV